MTLHPIPSELPYIWGKISFLFYECSHERSATMEFEGSIRWTVIQSDRVHIQYCTWKSLRICDHRTQLKLAHMYSHSQYCTVYTRFIIWRKFPWNDAKNHLYILKGMMYVVKTCLFAGRPVARGGGYAGPAVWVEWLRRNFCLLVGFAGRCPWNPPLLLPAPPPPRLTPRERQKRCLGLSLASLQADTAHDRLCKHRRNAHMLFKRRTL